MRRLGWLAAWLLAATAADAAPALFAPWNAGLNDEPAYQVQRIDDDSFVIRQSIRSNFEAPFLYLLFGTERALLLDSGASGGASLPAGEAIIAQWSAAHRRAPVPLVVAHSHSHSDHVAGDAAFADRPDTIIIGLKPGDVAAAFGISDWPRGIGHFDLGGRSLDIIAAPGHEPAHIMVHDAQTRSLFSGDSLYPGRLYVPIDQFSVYRDSIDRVVAFTRGLPIRNILGAHIEMRHTPREDYAPAASVHHDEHDLQLPYASLLELQAALHRQTGEPVRDAHDDFIIVPRGPR